MYRGGARSHSSTVGGRATGQRKDGKTKLVCPEIKGGTNPVEKNGGSGVEPPKKPVRLKRRKGSGHGYLAHSGTRSDKNQDSKRNGQEKNYSRRGIHNRAKTGPVKGDAKN